MFVSSARYELNVYILCRSSLPFHALLAVPETERYINPVPHVTYDVLKGPYILEFSDTLTASSVRSCPIDFLKTNNGKD